MEIINKLNSDIATVVGRAFWLNSALESKIGVAVARVHAESTTLRLPSQEQMAADPLLNPYWADASNTGRLQNYLLDLTQEDIATYRLTPGIFDGLQVKDGPRPKTNNSANVLSAKRHQQSQDWLQNDCIGQPSDY